jgi:hypothetical protein
MECLIAYLLFRGRPWPPAPGAVLDVLIIDPVLLPDQSGGEQVPGTLLIRDEGRLDLLRRPGKVTRM